MFLIEIYKDQYPVKTPEQLEKESDVGEYINMGSFGTVYEDKTNSANVIKIGTKVGGNVPEKDGFLAYINKIKNLRIPTVPQIDYIHIYQYPDPFSSESITKYCYKMGMERLYPAGDLSKKEWVHFVNKMTSPYQLLDIDTMDAKSLKQFVESKLSVIAHYGFFDITDTNEKRIKITIDEIKDPYLREVIATIKQLSGKYDLDLHSANFMFRKTPYGAQIVITDPLSFPKAGAW